jgi:hypothetical protein
VAAPEVADAARGPVAALTARLGARLAVRGEAGRARGAAEVARL